MPWPHIDKAARINILLSDITLGYFTLCNITLSNPPRCSATLGINTMVNHIEFDDCLSCEYTICTICKFVVLQIFFGVFLGNPSGKPNSAQYNIYVYSP